MGSEWSSPFLARSGDAGTVVVGGDGHPTGDRLRNLNKASGKCALAVDVSTHLLL